jgi:hypothetical protein
MCLHRKYSRDVTTSLARTMDQNEYEVKGSSVFQSWE